MQVAVIGAGVFGGWTAYHLLQQGVQVTLIDAWGPGNSKSSSGGETRIIRSIYGSDVIYTRYAARSLKLWQEYERKWNTPLLLKSGVMFLSAENDSFLQQSTQAMREHEISFELLSAGTAADRYPQIDFGGVETVVLEPAAGILTARENCRTVVKHFVAEGGMLKLAAVESPWNPGALKLSDGSNLQADIYVFACGPWLPRLFPDHLSHCIKPTKQDVLFVSTPPGSDQFTWQQLPCWADRTSKEVYYGIPDVQHRGFKLASDLRGREFDPDTESRLIDHESWQLAQDYLRRRFPLLGNSTLLETRVCQYENTPDLGLLVDRHPAAGNVWFVGGGSGHGYKHGPALGEYVAAVILDRAPFEAAFRLDRFTSGGPHTKATTISE